MMENRDVILEKIRKCMALAEAGSEHEAAAALRQAQKLMEIYQVSNAEMLAAGVKDARSKAGAISKPSSWEDSLAWHVAKAFGCRLIFSASWQQGWWVFIGVAPASEISAFSFDVLLRQALRARREFIDVSLKRSKKRTTKTRRADLFSHGWVHTACAQVCPLTPTEGAEEAIEAYMQLKHPNLEQLSTVDRNTGRNLSEKDLDAFHAGRRAGHDAQLHRGVGANQPRLLEG